MLASELKEILAEVPDDAVVVICNTVYDANPAELGGVFLMSNSEGDAMLGLISNQGECVPSVKMPQGDVNVKLFNVKSKRGAAGSESERWHLSEDGETYDYDAYGSMEDAIEAGKQKFGNDFYAGREVSWLPQIDEEKIIDDLRDQAYDFADEYADNWLISVKEKDLELLRKIMQEAFELWMFETGNQITFFMVEKPMHVLNGRAYRGWV